MIARSLSPLCPADRIRLIKDAFDQAGSAPIEFPKTYIGDRAAFSQQFVRGVGYALGIDRLSLQLSSVTALLALDAPFTTSLQMFSEIELPPDDETTCSDRLVPDLSSYFSTALVLAEGAEHTHDKTSRQQLLELLIRKFAGPASLAPGLRSLLHMHLSLEELGTIQPLLAQKLQSAGGGDRSFSFYLPMLDNALRPGLITAMTSAGEPPTLLANAYRSYLTKHFASARCSDNITNQKQRQLEKRIGDYLFTAQPLSPAELKPDKVVPVDPEKSLFGTDIADEMRQLVSEQKGKWNVKERDSHWLATFNKLLDEASSVKADDMSDSDKLLRRALLTSDLASVAPPDIQSQLILSVVNDLINSPQLKQDPVAFWAIACEMEKSATALSSAVLEQVLAAFADSGDPVLIAEARFNRLGLERAGSAIN
jgi:hypothetical protein